MIYSLFQLLLSFLFNTLYCARNGLGFHHPSLSAGPSSTVSVTPHWSLFFLFYIHAAVDDGLSLYNFLIPFFSNVGCCVRIWVHSCVAAFSGWWLTLELKRRTIFDGDDAL